MRIMRRAADGRARPDRRMLALLVLLLAAAASGWWLHSVEAPPAARGAAGGRQPDYYLTQFVATEMGAKGAAEHRLSAQSLYHYPDDQTATLTQPRLILFDSGRKVWDIAADQGLVSERERSIFLGGAVSIRYEGTGSGAADAAAVEIHTRDLYVWPDQQTAETREPVRIEHRNGVTRAVGMKADFAQRRVQLLSEVRGEYEP